MPDWFDNAYLDLLDLIENDGSEEIDGFAFLQDYYLDNEEKFLELLDIDKPDDFASKFLDRFQNWLVGKDPRFNVSSTGRWSLNAVVGEVDSEIISDKYTLSEAEQSLLLLQDFQLDRDAFLGLEMLMSRLEAMEDSRVVECSIRLSKTAAKIGKRDNELLSYWSKTLDFCKAFGDKKNRVDCCKELAYYYIKVSKYKEAAEVYRDAADWADDERLKIELLRDSRIQFQNCGDHSSASEVFVRKMDIKRSESRFFLTLFFITSMYGESPKVVLANIAFWIFLISLVLTPFMYGENFVGAGVSSKCRFADAFYYTMVSFTTLGYGDITPSKWYWKIASGFISFLGLLYTSLLMVTIVRKYSRS